MSRFNQILVSILIIQVAVAVAVFWPQSAAQANTGPLLADFSPTGVTQISVQEAGKSPVVLAKKGDGWVLPNADDYPANGTKIEEMLGKLAAVKTNRLVTKTDASHARLKVADDDFNRLLTLTKDDGSTQKVFIGSSAGAGATHVRLDGESQVFLTDQITSYDVAGQPGLWIDTQYYTVPQTATVAVSLENANGTFEFEKDGDTWKLRDLAESETQDDTAVRGLVNQAMTVRMTEPLGKSDQPDYGLAEPAATVTLTMADGSTQTLLVGPPAEDGSGAAAKYSESPYYVRVSDFVGKNFVEKTRNDFLKQEEDTQK
ncbi:MAG: DUF4340 domain-containing protein [Chloroflexi bacterium]|nr:MAG: DUF4340 domain-containing protein [Chloroflexota bacterium]